MLQDGLPFPYHQMHHRIVQLADDLNIFVSVLFFLQCFVVVQYLTMESFQVNFTVWIICYHAYKLPGTEPRYFGWWYRRFQLFGAADVGIRAVNGKAFPVLHNLTKTLG